MPNKTKCQQSRKGSALIFATIILFSLLAITVTLSAITVSDMKMSQKTKSTTGAFSNADSGVEWALNTIATTTNPDSATISSKFTMTGSKAACPGTFGCEISFLDKDGNVITTPATSHISDIKAVRSVGTQGADTQRAIEAAVAQSAGGSGCYISYAKPPVANRAAAPNDNCITGFIDKGSVGMWGACCADCHNGDPSTYFRPPGGSCLIGTASAPDIDEAHACCQS